MNFDERTLSEFTNISAGHAATALSKLLDRTMLTAPPRHYVIDAFGSASGLFEPDERAAGIFAELSGGTVAGCAGLVLARDMVEKTLHTLLGESSDTLDARSHSALCELGNIAISAAANALSELQGEVVIPSVPRLAFASGGGLALESLCYDVRDVPGHLFESAIFDRDSALQLRFLWVPRHL